MDPSGAFRIATKVVRFQNQIEVFLICFFLLLSFILIVDPVVVTGSRNSGDLAKKLDG
jgi:hypothetical protein